MKKEIMLVLLSVVLLSGVYGEMMISEIMYNPNGSDEGREWIEIYNKDEVIVNMTGWKLREANSNHALNQFQGGFIVAPEDFMIIARDGEKFRIDYPYYNKTILTSSFDLGNSKGEELSILDSGLNTINLVNYSHLAEEGFSIELAEASLNNSDMNNWIQGISKGTPGSIIKYNETVNETIPPAENNQTTENNNESNTSTVPEFNYLGTILALISVGVIFIVGRNR